MDEYRESLERGLARALQQLRTARGLTRAALAERAGISAAYVTKLEQGGRTPRPDKLAALARALEVEPEELTHFAISLGRSDAGEGSSTAQPTSVSYALDPTRPRPSSEDLESARLPAYLRRLVDADRTGELHPRLALHLEAHMKALLEAHPDVTQLDVIEELTRRLLAGGGADVTALRLAVRLVDEAGADSHLLETVLDRLISDARLARAQIVATSPTETVVHVLPTAVAVDDDGRLWVNPLARVHQTGLPAHDPLLRREIDGRITLDVRRIEEPDWAPRNPEIHCVRAQVVRWLPPAGPPTSEVEGPWDAYAESIIEIDWTEDATIRIEPRSDGTTEGTYPTRIDRVHVITAHNPAPNVLPPGENARRNEELERDMREADWTLRPAVGLSARPEEPWSESSFAVLGEQLNDVLEMARRYDQAAIYEWTPTDRAVVPTAYDDVRHSHGWSVTWH